MSDGMMLLSERSVRLKLGNGMKGCRSRGLHLYLEVRDLQRVRILNLRCSDMTMSCLPSLLLRARSQLRTHWILQHKGLSNLTLAARLAT